MKIVQITGRHNAELKKARQVRDCKLEGLLFAEGIRSVTELLGSTLETQQLFVASEALKTDAAQIIVQRAFDRGAEILELGGSLFASIADTASPQGIVAIAKRPTGGREAIAEAFRSGVAAVPIVVYLWEVNNPANLGTVVRTAEAAGAIGVACSPRSADAFSPKSLRGSMGSAFRFPVWQDAALGDVIDLASELGLVTTGTIARAGKDYSSADLSAKRILVFGSEAGGLPGEVAGRLAEHISIPTSSAVESLNLGVACGIILFEARRQNTSLR